MDVTLANQKLPVRDSDMAPTIYGDAMVSVSVTLNATITVATLRTDFEGRTKETVVSGRLVLPVTALVNLHSQIGQVLETLRHTGQLKWAQAGTPTRQ
jgi:hypothetical protein